MKLLVLALIPILIMVQASYFDMQGTITDVLAPNSLKIDDKIIILGDVNPTGLNRTQYVILMDNLRDWLVGKDVFVKGNYVYFDLHGSYNSVSINEMVQNDIQDIRDNFRDYVYRY